MDANGEANGDFIRAVNMLHTFMRSPDNTDGINEVAVELANRMIPDGDQVVRVFYSSPEYPPTCAAHLAERLDAMQLIGVQVQFVQSSPVVLL